MIVFRIDNLVPNRPYTDLLDIPIWLDNITQTTKFDIPVRVYGSKIEEKTEKIVEIELIVEDEAKK